MNMNFKNLPVLAFLLSFAMQIYSADISKLDEYLSPNEIWNITPETFLQDKEAEKYVKWLSGNKDTARYPNYKSPQMTFLDEKVIESIFRFSEGKLSKIEISLYNRGDVGDMSIDMLNEKAKALGDKIEKWASDKGVVNEKQRITTGMWIQKRAWVKDNTTSIVMLWSTTDHRKVERAEYLKIEIYKFDPKKDPRKTPMLSSEKTSEIKATASAKELKTNVKKNDDGYVFIENLPMVDQGDKGYCAVASAEVVLRYYGCEVDQHIIAQIAGTSADGGTDPEKMYDMLKKTSTKFGIKIKDIFSFDFGRLRKTLKKYNDVEKKSKMPETKFPNHGNILGYYNQMKLDILREARVQGEKTDYNKFCKEITNSVDEGVPLLWSLILGKAKESVELPQLLGGHMRIIKGYNKDKNEIVYMDSWGAKHEWKTMNIEDAWAVTTGLYVMEPRKK